MGSPASPAVAKVAYMEEVESGALSSFTGATGSDMLMTAGSRFKPKNWTRSQPTSTTTMITSTSPEER